MKPDHLSRPTWAEVHLDRLERNTRTLRERLPQGVKFMAAVKADGYGHGAVPAAKAVLNGGADALAVGLLDEAVQLREGGILAPILVLTPIKPADADRAADLELSLTVFQASWLTEMRACKRTDKPLRLHIKLDTGLGRLGIREQQEFTDMVPLLRAEDIIVEGVYTHFSTAQLEEPGYYNYQLARFAEMRGWIASAGFRPQLVHASNSAAALQYPEHSMDMVRVGASLYGIDPCEPSVKRRTGVQLEQTLSLHSEIIHCKQVDEGSAISYDTSYRTTHTKEWIATVPLGYADGCFRGFKGTSVLVDGQRVPIVGNICMDQLMIRLPRYYPPGTRVTFIGRQEEEEITLDERAEQIGSIPQQILSLITQRVPRIYTRNAILIEQENKSYVNAG